MEILGIRLPEMQSHDSQHYAASMVAMITGLTIFAAYYFFSRAESHARGDDPLPWRMPWWYFVAGGVLAAFAASSIACALSMAVRPREISIKKA